VAEDDQKPDKSGVSRDRKARLAAELRENLKRRKSRSRARDESEAPGQQSRKGRPTLIEPD